LRTTLETSPGGERLKGPLELALSLIVNIRLGGKDLPGANSLGYFASSIIIKKKIFNIDVSI
jgi:hypothetical protein